MKRHKSSDGRDESEIRFAFLGARRFGMGINMRFRKELYLGEGIRNSWKIRRRLKTGAGMLNLYVISIASGSNQLECTHCSFFKQRLIRENVGLIVGLAKGYPEAQQLMITMIEDSLRLTGTPNVKEYLLSGR